jgi:nucleoside-diphosphate-sugar epimerase
MDTTKARTQLGWRPRHDIAETLSAMVQAGRSERLIR